MPKPPRRAVVLTAEIQADNRSELASALFNLAMQIDRAEIVGPTVISGGYSSGYILHITENEEQTHDAWALQVKEFLTAKREEANGGTSTGGGER
jgi:hypothetical protein